LDSVICGIFGGIAGIYFYDRGMSKGDDFAVGMGGLFAVGTFTFVVVFTRLRKVHHPVSSSTSLFAFYACLIFPLAATLLLRDANYWPFAVGDWLAILLFGLLSLVVCRRWWQESD
jgi:drug/metabolite transporter (DMT)-like permease